MPFGLNALCQVLDHAEDPLLVEFQETDGGDLVVLARAPGGRSRRACQALAVDSWPFASSAVCRASPTRNWTRACRSCGRTLMSANADKCLDTQLVNLTSSRRARGHGAGAAREDTAPVLTTMTPERPFSWIHRAPEPPPSSRSRLARPPPGRQLRSPRLTASAGGRTGSDNSSIAGR